MFNPDDFVMKLQEEGKLSFDEIYIIRNSLHNIFGSCRSELRRVKSPILQQLNKHMQSFKTEEVSTETDQERYERNISEKSRIAGWDR